MKDNSTEDAAIEILRGELQRAENELVEAVHFVERQSAVHAHAREAAETHARIAQQIRDAIEALEGR